MKKVLKLAALSVVLFLSACGSDKNKEDNFVGAFTFDGKNGSTVYPTLIAEINELENALALDQLLQNSPERSKGQILSAIALARSGVRIVAKFDSENTERMETAHSLFTSAIGQYDSFKALDFEQFRFDEVFNKIKQLREQIGLQLGVEDNYTWVLYNHNFADGIEPYFNMFPGKDSRGGLVKWVTNFQTGIPKAKVQGREAWSWIVSKPFPIAHIKNPTFRYFTQFTVVAPNPKDSLNDVVNKAFQTYIILDQLPGEDPETIDPGRKIRINYDIDDLPLARNFHDAWVPKVSLEKYKNHKVSIAFLFDTRQIEETQYYIWDIFDVEIEGAGVWKDPASVYSPNFKDNLGGFKSLSLKFGGEKWRSSRDGISVKAGSGETDALIISPIYSVTTDTSRLRMILADSLKGEGSISSEVLISRNYRGAVDPMSPEITWEVLRSKTEGFEKEQSVYDLNKYIGSDIVIGFRMKTGADSDTAWFLDQMYLETEGKNLTEVEYSVPDPDQKFILASQELLKINFRDLRRIYESEELSPEWKKGSKNINISGFVRGGAPLTGKSQMIFPEVDLTSSTSNKLRINYGMQFVKKESVVKFHIRESCVDVEVCENEWAELPFPTSMFTSRLDDMVTSSWVNISTDFDGSKVEISVTYKALKGNTPGFLIDRLEVGGVK